MLRDQAKTIWHKIENFERERKEGSNKIKKKKETFQSKLIRLDEEHTLFVQITLYTVRLDCTARLHCTHYH